MNKLSYNDPNRIKERQEAEAPKPFEIQSMINIIDGVLPAKYIQTREVLQRLIDHHQNLQNFYSVAGGWDGLLKLQSQSGAPQTGDIEVNYEIVKTK